LHQSLPAAERRVFGVLLEKALAQPSYYPMTLNAIVAACNQKSNRDPLTSLDEDAVYAALEALRQRGLVARLLAGMSGRVDRFKHDAKDRLGWEKPQRAVMAELLLRGPQTLGELRSRCSRMFPFENVEAVTAVVQGLCQGENPVVAALPRASGQSVIRYTHRLYPDGERPTETQSQVPEPQSRVTEPTCAEPSGESQSRDEPEPLGQQLDAVQTEIGELHAAIAELRRRLDALEGEKQ
jgi:uncharacterized protein